MIKLQEELNKLKIPHGNFHIPRRNSTSSESSNKSNLEQKVDDENEDDDDYRSVADAADGSSSGLPVIPPTTSGFTKKTEPKAIGEDEIIKAFKGSEILPYITHYMEPSDWSSSPVYKMEEKSHINQLAMKLQQWLNAGGDPAFAKFFEDSKAVYSAKMQADALSVPTYAYHFTMYWTLYGIAKANGSL